MTGGVEGVRVPETRAASGPEARVAGGGDGGSAATVLRRVLARVARRERSLVLVEGVGAGGVLGGALGLAWFLLTLSGVTFAPGAPGLDAPGGAVLMNPGPGALLLLVLAGMAGGALRALRTLRVRRARRAEEAPPGPEAFVAGARILEAHLPAARNVVRTAAELLEGWDRGRTPAPVRQAILTEAALRVEGVDPSRLLPPHRAILLGAGAVALALVLALGPTAPPGEGPLALRGSPPASAPGEGALRGELTVSVEPPAWIEGETRVFRDPVEVDALEGGRLHLELRLAGSPEIGEVRVETVEGGHALVREGEGWRLTLPARADGFLSLEARDEEGVPRWRHLAGLTLRPDEPPELRIVEPGRDLRFAHGDQQIEVVVEATDDHALADLELVYTRVSGFGELFEFEEGEIPLQIERHGPRSWTGRATWSLAPLALDRGESVVYHARARDRRPGAEPGTSETWMVEVLGGDPGVSGGFAGEDELTRYALSQQMVNLMMDRLQEGRDTLSAEAFQDEVLTLAAAQRRVRAEFVFMLGGELADDVHAYDDPLTGDVRDALPDPFDDPDDHDHGDPDHDPAAADLHEEAHARADQDAAEGRLAQQGRQELSRAVQAMSRAATFLGAADLPPARDQGQVALEHLQRAFSSSRYILRAMSEREELDLARRLTGERVQVLPDRRAGLEPPPDPHLSGLRQVLAGVAAEAGAGTPDPNRLLTLASRLLALAPGDPEHRALATALRDAAEAGAPGVRRRETHEAFAGVAALVRRGVESAPPPSALPGVRRMEGALAEALGNGPRPPVSGDPASSGSVPPAPGGTP